MEPDAGAPAAAAPEAAEDEGQGEAVRRELKHLRGKIKVQRMNAARLSKLAAHHASSLQKATLVFADNVATKAKHRGVSNMQLKREELSSRQRRMSRFSTRMVTRLTKAVEKSKKTKGRIPDSMSVQMAASDFTNSGGLAAVARAYGCHKANVGRHAQVLAEFTMESQRLLLDSISDRISGGASDILYACSAAMYDETGQTNQCEARL